MGKNRTGFSLGKNYIHRKGRNAHENNFDIDRIKQEKIENNNYNKKYLPIHPFKGKILEAIRKNSVVMILGSRGCEKSTQAPQ